MLTIFHTESYRQTQKHPPELFYKKISEYSQENTCAESLLFCEKRPKQLPELFYEKGFLEN